MKYKSIHLVLFFGIVIFNSNVFAQKLPDLIPFRSGKLMGFCDSNLNVVLKPNYRIVQPFVEGMAIVTNDNLSGYIAEDGREVVPCKYKFATSFFMGHAKVGESRDDYHFINKKGERVPGPLAWERLKRNAEKYHLNYLRFEKDGLKGVIDKNGKVIIPVQKIKIEEITPEGIIVYYEKDYKYSIVNAKGDILTRKHSHIDNIKEERFYFQGYGSSGYLSIHGDTIISSGFAFPHYSESQSTTDDYDERFRNFYEGRAIVRSDKKYGYIDLNGDLVIDTLYDYTFNFKEGRAKVKLNGKYGFIDKNGNIIADIKYDQACYFYEGRAQVVLGDKCTYLDLNGEEVLPFKYDYWQTEQFSSFENGFARVRINEKFGMINWNGDSITELKYDNIWPFIYGRAIVRLDGKFGVIDTLGNEIIPIIYKGISRLDQFVFRITNESYHRQNGLISRDGKIILPVENDRPNIEIGPMPGFYIISRGASFDHFSDNPTPRHYYYLVDKYGTKYLVK